MGARSRTPTQAPAKKPGQPQQSPAAGPQDQLGNDAIKNAMPSGPEDVQSTLLEHTDNASISVGGRLPGNLKLGEKDGNSLATGEPTSFSLGVGRNGLFANFHPGIQVRPGSFWARAATGGITISSLYYSFQGAKADLTLDTGLPGDVLDVFFDFKQSIEDRFAAGLKGALPARLQQPGFDPYTDPELPGLLQKAVNGLGSAFPSGAPAGGPGGPELMDKIQQPTITASVNPKPIEMPLQDGLKLILTGDAALELTAHLQGNMGDALTDPRIGQLDVSTRGVTVEHERGGKLASIDVRSLVFGGDLSLQRFDYDLALESGLSALKLLGMLAQLRTGQDLGIRDQNAVRLDGIRAMIDGETRQKLPKLLKEQILANDKALPGFSLKKMFGMAP